MSVPSLVSLSVMVALQHECNKVMIAQDYLDNPPPKLNFALAANKEYFEGFDHLDYKWWKDSAANIKQFQIEMIDCLHFSLSELLQFSHRKGQTLEESVELFHSRVVEDLGGFNQNFEQVQSSIEDDINNGTETFESFVRGVLVTHQSPFVSGSCLERTVIALAVAQLSGMSLDELVNAYIAKNTLNIFRTTHGYNGGGYIKNWFGQEDNVTIENYLAANDMSQPDAIQALNAHLEAVYATVVAAQA